MSWLVAPRCTCAAAGPSTASVSAAFSGTTGLPDPLAPAAIAAASKRSARHAAAIASASASSIKPGARERARERRLGVEHRLQPRLVRDRRGRAAARGDRVEHGLAPGACGSSVTKRVAMVSSRWTTPITMKNAAAVPSSENPSTNGAAIRKIAST